MKNAALPVVLSALLISLPAQAENMAVTAVAGTSGLGIDVGYMINSEFQVRGVLRGFSLSLDDEYDDIEYEGDLNLSSVGILADYFPETSWFRATAGLFANDNDVELVAVEAAVAEIGDLDYRVNGKLETDITFDSVAPYLGIGFGNPQTSSSQFGMSLELGILFQGSPQAVLQASGTATELSTNTTFVIDDVNDPAAQLLNEEIQKEEDNLNSDIDEFKYYPVISLGVSYRF